MYFVKFLVLTSASVKMAFVPCSLLGNDRLMAQTMQTVSASETSVIIYQATQCSILEDNNFHTYRLENLKSHRVVNRHVP